MKYTHLGRTGLIVSRLCLGTMNFGVTTSEADSHAIMDRALELGINFFDTADRYGKPQGGGGTEEIVGRWLAQGGRRDRIVLATKVFGPMGPGANDEGLSAYHIRQGCLDSLRRLQTDRIDLYQMHHIPRGTPHYRSSLEYLNGDRANLYFPPHARMDRVPWDEIWQAMEQLVREGKAIYIGSSNFAGWNVAQANERAAARHFLGLVSEQSLYNLNARMVELELLPACKAYGLGFMCWSPLSGGLLAGALRKAEQGRRSNLSPDEALRAKLQAYESLCHDVGEEPANVALAWLLHNPVVTAPIIGPRTIEQLESAVRAVDITLPEDVLERLDELWPGPGNQAPEAYAW
jgi:aryl-alcohol dehydrogenase-like predicted oxidoreductase